MQVHMADVKMREAAYECNCAEAKAQGKAKQVETFPRHFRLSFPGSLLAGRSLIRDASASSESELPGRNTSSRRSTSPGVSITASSSNKHCRVSLCRASVNSA